MYQCSALRLEFRILYINGKLKSCWMWDSVSNISVEVNKLNQQCIIYSLYLHFCYGLAVAGNKSATRPHLPPPGCGGEWKENRQKLVGWDKGSLTEQQTKEQ